MRLLSLSEASIQIRTNIVKFARSPCTDPPGALRVSRRAVIDCDRTDVLQVEEEGMHTKFWYAVAEVSFVYSQPT